MSEPPADRPIKPEYSSEPQPRPAQVIVQATSQEDMVRAIAATRSFYGPAILTLVLYWFTFWIGGLIANLVYLNSASNAQKLSGVSPEGKGCLWLLLIAHVILPILGACAFFALGGLAMLAGGNRPALERLRSHQLATRARPENYPAMTSRTAGSPRTV